MSSTRAGPILIVDDTEANRYTIARVLSKAGYEVIEGANGVEGLRQLEHRPELVIVDVRMPEMDGYEFCRRVRASPSTSVLPILQISATYTELQDVVSGLEAGADAYLTHPVDPAVLLATVRALLRAKRAEEQVQRMERTEAVARLAGGIAHETNNQMSVVLGLAAFVASATNLTPEQQRDLAQIKDAAERVARLTGQLLALSRRQLLQPEVVDLSQICQESAITLRRVLGPEVEVTVDLADDAQWVRADRAQLAQVLLNLALNARDAMPSGGRLTLASRVGEPPAPRGRLARTWLPDQTVVVLTVSDTGTGIDPVIQGRIFDPFFSTKGVGQGSGLGLSVVEGIVEQSGGDLWLESEPGTGTRFIIALPRVAGPGAEATDGTATIPAAHGETILVVEDEDTVRSTLARGLHQYGYRVLEAANGQEALELVRHHPQHVDAIVTDIAMPGMSGLELAQHVRAHQSRCPFVFISGYPPETFAGAVERVGRSTFLQKPFAPDALASAVGKVVALPSGVPPAA